MGASNDGHLPDLHPHPSMKSLEQQVFRRVTCFVVALMLLFQSAGAVAPGPVWWSQKEVLDPDAGADDFAAANIGQLKFMASRAAEALDQAEAADQRPLTTLQTEAKTAIGSMIGSWNAPPEAGVTRDDFHALNTGQLKHVAGLFYQRLGLPPPWAAGAPGADDFRMVNVGQLKQAFSFELRVARGGPPMAVPDAVLQAAYAAWSVLPSTQRAAGSTPDDFDGDGISNLQEYLMQPGLPLFDLNDKDGDGIADSIEAASGGILNPLVFSDAVDDHDGDGVMNYEEVRLGLSLTTDVTPGRGDGLTDAEVLAWGLLAGVPLAPSTDAIRACWEVIDEEWIEEQGGMAFYGHWLDRTLDNNNQPAGWTAFQTEFSGPWNPDAWFIENPPIPIDLDGDEIPDMDRDADGLPDVWEFRYQFNPRDDDDNMEDPDGDTLTNLVEFANRTHPRLADSDGDGFSDIEEQAHGSDPLLGGSVPPVVLQLTGKSAHQHYPGEITPPLAVRATQAGIVRMGAEVTFTLMTGGGTLSPASQNGASAATSLTVTTGADGVAAITYTAAGQPEKAIVLATVPGGAAATAFTVKVIAVPEEFSGAGTGGGGRLGGTGGGQVGGISSVLPAASRLFEALLAASDGMFLRHAFKLDKDKQFPKEKDGWFYLGTGQKLDAVSSGGYGTIDQLDPTKGVSHHKRIVFEGATAPCSRTYLVLFFQDERVTESLDKLMKLDPPLAAKTGTLTFTAQDHNTRKITINGSIPQEYMKQIKDTDGNPAVDFLGPAPTKEDKRFWMVLLPIDLTGHRRGTSNAPAAVSAGGTYGEETVLLESADRDEGNATQRDLDTATLDKANDDDLVKVVLSFPANTKPAGVGLKLKHEGMKVDGTKSTFDSAVAREDAIRLNFYDDQGNKLTDADLKIDDLANPGSGYMAKIVTAGTLTLFIEGADDFGMVGISDQSETNAKYMGGALLTLEMTGTGAAANSGPRLLVFRGGFMRYRHPNGQPGELGTLEFRDGKGRITNDNTDLGTVIKTWSARSGLPGGAAYNVKDGHGHAPPGWRLIFRRTDFNVALKQTNTQVGAGDDLVVKQGSYCRWFQDDNPPGYTETYIYRENDANDKAIGKPAMETETSSSGQTIMFKFQTEVIPPTSEANRSDIQIHPDGKKNGSDGCISIQSYDDCKEVYRYLYDYRALKLKIDLE